MSGIGFAGGQVPFSTPVSEGKAAESQSRSSTPAAVAVAGQQGGGGGPAAPRSTSPAPGQGSASPAPATPAKEVDIVSGVGGPLMKFRLAAFDGGKESATDYVDFEMAPARKSFFDRQGQQVPGAGAGLATTVKPSLAKLKVPGTRPVYQHMGIDEELVEFVGAFVGDEIDSVTDGWGMVDNQEYAELDKGKHDFHKTSAWERSQKLARFAAQGRPMIMHLVWGQQGLSGKRSSIDFHGGGTGGIECLIKFVSREHATASRVYYRITLAVTNRQDVNQVINDGKGLIYRVPGALQASLEALANTNPAGGGAGADKLASEKERRAAWDDACRVLRQQVTSLGPTAEAIFVKGQEILFDYKGFSAGALRGNLNLALQMAKNNDKVQLYATKMLQELDNPLNKPFKREGIFVASPSTIRAVEEADRHNNTNHAEKAVLGWAKDAAVGAASAVSGAVAGAYNKLYEKAN